MPCRSRLRCDFQRATPISILPDAGQKHWAPTGNSSNLSRVDMRLRLRRRHRMQALASLAFTHGVLFDRFSDGIPLCENIGHNLLVLALCLSSVRTLFKLGFGPLHAWTAAGRLSAIYIPGWISVPHFPKIGRLTAPVGYICWDFLFSVVVGFYGWTTRQDLFDDFTNLPGPIIGSGHRLFTAFMVGQRRGGLATSVMSSRLPCYFASNEENKRKRASSRSKSRLWRDIDGKICGLLLQTANSWSTRREMRRGL